MPLHKFLHLKPMQNVFMFKFLCSDAFWRHQWRKHEIDKELPYCDDRRWPIIQLEILPVKNSIMACFRKWGELNLYTSHACKLFFTSFYLHSSVNFNRSQNGSGILEILRTENWTGGQNWRTGTGPNRSFGSGLSVRSLHHSELNSATLLYSNTSLTIVSIGYQ